jgi:hypothetical protein
MRKKYKNQIFHFLKESDLDFDRFDIKEVYEITELDGTEKKSHITIITFSNTPFEFKIVESEVDYETVSIEWTVFNPAFSKITTPTASIKAKSLINYIEVWIKNEVKEYIDDEGEPDLWEEYKSGTKVLDLGTIDFKDKASFSTNELAQIKMSVNELQGLIIKQLTTSQEEQQIVKDRLDYLVDASKRLNKFDWMSVTINTLINISVALSLNTEKGHLLFELFKKVFNTLKVLATQ